MARVTVIIPTHNHGETLRSSVASAMAQTEADLDIVVIGDGVPDVTRDVMADLQRGDSRVRFLDHPKGPRHGEVYRHAVLSEADSDVVCYLGDDDLWLPDHVETMCGALATADFANALPVVIEPDQRMVIMFATDLRRRHNCRNPLIPFTTAAHTMALYRRLPGGWQTTPTGIATDVHMWKRLLAIPGSRGVSTFRWTSVNLSSATRPDMSNAERVAELEVWAARLRDQADRPALLRELLAREAEARALVDGSASFLIGSTVVRALRPLRRVAGRRFRLDRG